MHGIRSLNAGAPDLRLSGDQTQRGTYTQRRRTQMAGGGITNARQGYGLGSLVQGLKDKFVEDIIPNEIKESPIGTALVGGALLNQFGLPGIPGLDTKGMGQNWLGELLGTDLVYGPGGEQSTIGTLGNLTGINMDPYIMGGGIGGAAGPFDYLQPGWELAQRATNYPFLGDVGGSMDYMTDDRGLIQRGIDAGMNFIRDAAGNLVNAVTGQKVSGTGTGQGVNIAVPMAIGAAAGLAQKKYIEDQPPFPMDETGIKFQTAAEAMADPNLRFKPEEQYANVAEGGRIGYQEGGNDPQAQLMADYKKYKDMGGTMTLEEFAPLWIKGGLAQGGRIGADEGGLMNLGGMEKDYRQEGGFVPIGGEEKADDVPARLSKNEFVFTADAVRSAGGGDIDAGAEVMENLMEHLEAGGEVSEDSQGLEGAQEMFANTQRLQNRII